MENEKKSLSARYNSYNIMYSRKATWETCIFILMKLPYLGKKWLSMPVHFLDRLYHVAQCPHLSLVCGPKTFSIDGTFLSTGNNKVVSHATKRSSLKLKLKKNSQHYSISFYVKVSTSQTRLLVIGPQMRIQGWHEWYKQEGSLIL